MSEQINQNAWETQLRNELGTAPKADYQAWLGRYSGTLQQLTTTQVVLPASRRSIAAKAKWIVAAAALFAIGGWFWFDNSVNPRAFADSIPGVDEVQTMSWTTTVYEKITSKDGNRSWMTKRVLSKDEFRYPGQRRTTYVDKSGQITRIEIRDDRVGRILELQPASKTAILKMASAAGDQRSPFAFIGDGIRTRKCEGVPVKSVSLQTPRILDGKKVNVVRLAVNAGDGWPAHVFQAMFDQESKGLVCLMTPGGPEFSDIDPDLAVAKSGPAETDFSKVEMARAKHHEIVVNPRIDASEFSLDPPAGYALQTQAKPTVTEEEMVEFLRVAAGLNGGTFPDSTGWWFLADSVWEKKESDRSAAENAAISLKFKFAQKDIYTAPVLVFQEQHTKPDTFCYVGAGVKLGEADRMVCWYQPRNQSKFRVIHGDMSIKELSASELPLNPDK